MTVNALAIALESIGVVLMISSGVLQRGDIKALSRVSCKSWIPLTIGMIFMAAGLFINGDFPIVS